MMRLSLYKSLLNRLRSSEPQPEWLKNTRQEILGYMEARPVVRNPEKVRHLSLERPTSRFLILGLKPMPVAISALVLALLSGTGVAAQQSLPTSLLYPIKIATEQVRLALTPSSEGKVKAHLDFAEHRLAEVESLSAKGASDNLIATTLNRYGSEIEAVTTILPSMASTTSKSESYDKLALDVSKKFVKYQESLNNSIIASESLSPEPATVSQPLPTEAKVAAIKMLDVTQASEARVLSLNQGQVGGVAAAEPKANSFTTKPSSGMIKPRPDQNSGSYQLTDGLEIISGQMRFSEVEGGCWYLAGSKGKNYQLVGKLAASLFKPGLYVKVAGGAAKDLASTCMVGELFEVAQVLEQGAALDNNEVTPEVPASDSTLKPN